MSSNNIFATRALLQKYGDHNRSRSYDSPISGTYIGPEYDLESRFNQKCMLKSNKNNKRHIGYRPERQANFSRRTAFENARLNNVIAAEQNIAADLANEQVKLEELRIQNCYLREQLDAARAENNATACAVDQAAYHAVANQNAAAQYSVLANQAAAEAEYARAVAIKQKHAFNTAFLDAEDDISCDDDSATAEMKIGLNLQEKAAAYAALAGQKLNSAKIQAERKAALTSAKANAAAVTALAASSALQEQTPGLSTYDPDCAVRPGNGYGQMAGNGYGQMSGNGYGQMAGNGYGQMAVTRSCAAAPVPCTAPCAAPCTVPYTGAVNGGYSDTAFSSSDISYSNNNCNSCDMGVMGTAHDHSTSTCSTDRCKPTNLGRRLAAPMVDECGNCISMDMGVHGQQLCEDGCTDSFQTRYDAFKTSALEAKLLHTQAALQAHQSQAARLSAVRALEHQLASAKHAALTQINAIQAGTDPVTLANRLQQFIAFSADQVADIALGRENNSIVTSVDAIGQSSSCSCSPTIQPTCGCSSTGSSTNLVTTDLTGTGLVNTAMVNSNSGVVTTSFMNSNVSASTDLGNIPCNCTGISPTPTPTPGTCDCGIVETGTLQSTDCECRDPLLPSSNRSCDPARSRKFCEKVRLNCGVEFNDNEFRFGPCAVEIYNEQTHPNPSHDPTDPTPLTELVNIIDYNSSSPVYFKLPPFSAPPPSTAPNAKGFVLDGQILFVSNTGTSEVIIRAVGTTINDGKDALILLPAGNLPDNRPFNPAPPYNAPPKSGIMFIASGSAPSGKWYTLL